MALRYHLFQSLWQNTSTTKALVIYTSAFLNTNDK